MTSSLKNLISRHKYSFGISVALATTYLYYKKHHSNNNEHHLLTTTNHYYTTLHNELASSSSSSLHESGVVIDLDTLDKNIDTLLAHFHESQRSTLRLSTKSLPSIPLLVYIAERIGTQRAMVFTTNMLERLLTHPSTQHYDFLFGVPQTVPRIRRLFTELAEKEPKQWRVLISRVQFLVDTNTRLCAYIDLANEFGIHDLRVNIEIDVGLHRGGATVSEARNMFTTLSQSSVSFSGYMGYDGHAPFHPLGGQHRYDAELAQCVANYQQFIHLIPQPPPSSSSSSLCFNGAGSATVMAYKHTSTTSNKLPMNDFTVGSALLKPASFDLSVGNLPAMRPAIFVVAPVIKLMNSQRSPIPFMPWIWRFYQWWRREQYAQSVYVSGCAPSVQPVYPPNLTTNPLMSSSSSSVNQLPTQSLYHTSSSSSSLKPDSSYVIFRPAHNDAMCSYMHVQLLREMSIIGTWPVYRHGI